MMINSILTGIIGFLVSTIMGYLVKSSSNIKKESKLIKQSILTLERAELSEICEKYLDKGFCPEYARYIISDLYANYSALGGNHGITQLVNRVLELDLKPQYNRRKGDWWIFK